ncbi:MAG: O-methyltransferase [Owenweeksia sp.]
MEFLPEKLEQYVEDHTTPESEVLQELNRETWSKVLQPRMLSGHLQGRVLSMLSKMIQPKRILEIGTYTGYSALCLAEGLQEEGKLHTIDINEELEDMVNSYIEKAGYSDRIQMHVGDATQIIPALNESWDIVFIDADKENYSNYFDLTIDHLRPGGYIIADNVLWSGKVIQKVDPKDEETQALMAFNEKVLKDDRVENALFPVRDGLMVCRKR